VPPPIIELRNVTKVFRLGDVEVRALGGVNLKIEPGAFVAIMGSSGSGKSTLMNILGCLDRPTAGDYFLEGEEIGRKDEPALARLRSERIGFVFQSFNLLPRTSAAENVALPLLYSGRHGDGAARVSEALQAIGLAGREQNHPSQLSGGQQQRVAIARALINNPAILLADEPTGNLDTKTSNEIMATIQALNRERGLTVVLVTHEPDMALYAERIITMRDGMILTDEVKGRRVGPMPTAPAVPSPAAGGPRTSAVLPLLWMALGAAWQAMARNKMRSALTMLGIFIGVAALITMVAVGQGANAAVKAQIESLGANLLIVLPGATTTGGVRAGFGSASTLTVADAESIQKGAPAVIRVGYLIRQATQLQYANKNWNTSVQGVNPSYLDIRVWPVVAGRSMIEEDDDTAARVCLIGQTVLRNLFGAHENPIGATIFIKNVPMQVIGLLQAKGQTGFGQDQDDVVLIPFTTAERKVLGVAAPSQSQANQNATYDLSPNPFGLQPKLTGYVNTIFVQARTTELVPMAKEQLSQILTARHHVPAGQPADFDVRNISDITQAAESSAQIMAILLAAVASISLVVGGIGIMNILLVSVTERTREIGIRMAVGARRAHVLMQFLIEAVLLSGIGGLVGILAGVAISEGISLAAGWPTQLSSVAMAGGFLFSAAVGVFFGYYPARRASRLNPIEALRYE